MFSGWSSDYIPRAPAGEVCIGQECGHWPLHSRTGNLLPLSAQGTFEWVVFQCYLSWMYDRFCTLDKEKTNNNDSSGKKVTYFKILLSLPETLFHRMLTKFHLNLVYLYLISSTSLHPICLLRNTVNAPMYPNVKCYLYFNIHNYIFFGGEKVSVSCSAHHKCFSNRWWKRSESKYLVFHSSLCQYRQIKKNN